MIPICDIVQKLKYCDGVPDDNYEVDITISWENVSKAGNENSHWVRYKAINCKHVSANYLCCVLFFFQHYWKVFRLIVFFFGKMDVSFEDISSKSRYSEPSPFTIFSINVANGFSCDSVIFFLISIFFSLKTARFLRSTNWYW